ncbi:MAG: hypothetical protein V3T05_08600 [Myxococcota bacterium]
MNFVISATFGAYQGEGGLSTECVLQPGTVSRVRMVRYDQNGG